MRPDVFAARPRTAADLCEHCGARVERVWLREQLGLLDEHAHAGVVERARLARVRRPHHDRPPPSAGWSETSTTADAPTPHAPRCICP